MSASPNLLWGYRTYISGPIEKANLSDMVWRDDITKFFESKNIIVLDPLKKDEFLHTRFKRPPYFDRNKFVKKLENLRKNKQWDKLKEHISPLRNFDLRVVDISDFVTCYLDIEIPTCGTFEEIFWANRCKKPVLIVAKQGLDGIMNWLFGTFPQEHIFETWEELKEYISNLDAGKLTDVTDRWTLIDYKTILKRLSSPS